MSAAPMLVALSEIRPDPRNPRTVLGDVSDLTGSIARLGVLQPIIVREDPEGQAIYMICFGWRRYEAAKAAGLQVVPCVLFQGDDESLAAAQTAENLGRAGLKLTDQWRAMKRIVDEGTPLEVAAAQVGIHIRLARQLWKMGNGPAELHAAVDLAGLPPEWAIGTISLADPKVLIRALKKTSKEGRVDWRDVASACETKRVPASHAIFDIEESGIAFDEDMFAPANQDARSTTDVRGFLAQQNRALEALCKRRMADGENVLYSRSPLDYGGEFNGWQYSHRLAMKDEHAKRYEKKTEALVAFVEKTGMVHWVHATRSAAKGKTVSRTARDPAPVAANDAPAHVVQQFETAESDGTLTEPPAPADGEDPGAAGAVVIGKLGAAVVAQRKIEAVRRCLADPKARLEHLTAALVIALTAPGVKITNEQGNVLDMSAILPMMLNRPGHVRGSDGVVQAVCEAMLNILPTTPPRGRSTAMEAVERIGVVLGAGSRLGRFDTAEFLAHVTPDALRAAAAAAGIKGSQPGKLRERLQGKLPDWSPVAFEPPPMPEVDAEFAEVGEAAE